MEIQGTEEAIDKVIQSIESGRYVWIQNMDVTPLYPEPDGVHYHQYLPKIKPGIQDHNSGILYVKKHPEMIRKPPFKIPDMTKARLQ